MIRYTLAAMAAAAVGFVQAASAADMPVKAPIVKAPAVTAYNWGGCYVGAYAGGGWGARSATSRDIDGYNGPDTWSYDVNGSVIAGGTLGCNYVVSPHWVLGAEGEFGYMHVSGSALDPFSPILPLDTEAKTRIGNWYGVIAGRVGYAWDRFLVYGKAGVAFANVEVGVNDTLLQPVVGNTILTRTSSTKAALAAGAGLEYGLTNNWTLKGEYLYMDFTANDTTCGVASVGGGTFCWANSFRGVHTAKIGLNYFFGR